MTILWCGAEELDFKGVVVISTSTSYFDSNYARCAINIGQSGSDCYIQFTVSPVHSFWFGARIKTGYSVEDEAYLIRFGNLINQQIFLRVGVNGTLYLQIGAAVVDTSDPSLIADYSNYKLDIKIVDYNQENAGTINVYWNENLILTYTGTLYSELVSNINAFRLYGQQVMHGAYMSEMIIADTDTRSLRLKTLVPNAAGDVNEWETGAYTDIDEVAKTVHDFVKTEEADNLFLANLSDMPSGLWAIHAVKVAAATSPAYNGLGLKIGVKTNNVVHLGPLIQTTWYDTVEQIYNLNPQTTQVFTKAEVNALQIAVESEEVV